MNDPTVVVLTPEAAREGRKRATEKGKARSRARVVELRGAGADPAVADEPSGDAPSPGAPTDDEVRAELREGSHYLRQEVTLQALNAPLPAREITLEDAMREAGIDPE